MVLRAMIIGAILHHGMAIVIPGLSQEAYIHKGDFDLGILIPVHTRSTEDFCGSTVLNIAQLQRLEAIAFAIQELNQRNSILPNHTIGFVMFDDCHSDQTALAQALHFTRPTLPHPSHIPPNLKKCLNPGECLNLYDVMGVIGSENSITTLQAANLLTSLRIPQLSYFSTSPTLSNQGKYSLFQRIVPSDNIQAEVLLQLMASFNWTFIYVVYSEGAYGEGLYRAMERNLQENANDRTTCFVEPFVITQDFEDEDYEHVVWTMLQERIANVCLVIAQDFEAHALINAATKLPGNGEKMMWVAADAWARNLQSLSGMLSELHGMISVNFYATNVPRFDKHFQGINASFPSRNPWVREYWEQFFNCTTANESDACSPGLKLSDHPTYVADNSVSLVFDAVKTFALAIDSRVRTHCKGLPLEIMKCCVKNGLGDVLREVSFVGEASDFVEFDENGDGMISYQISNIQRDNVSSIGYQLQVVGLWDKYTQVIDLDLDAIEWPGGRKPASNCSYPCRVGEAMELHQKRCCWACVPCLDYQYTCTEHGITTCHNCPQNQWPDQETRSTCLDMQPVYIDPNTPLGAALTALATVGIGLSTLVFVLYLQNNQHPLIKASSRELSYCMLAGIAFSFIALFALVASPTKAICFLCEASIVVAFTMIYTPLAIKTIRIWRIFEAGKLMTKKPRCVSCSSQMMLTAIFVAAQAVIISVWSVNQPPKAVAISTGSGNLEIFCSFPFGPFVTCMSINIVLLLVSAVFAVKARNLPDNFNECRFISFCALSTILLWLAFLASYFTTLSVYRALFLALMVFSNGCIMHGGLFLPKLYAVYFMQKIEVEPAEKSSTTKS